MSLKKNIIQLFSFLLLLWFAFQSFEVQRPVIKETEYGDVVVVRSMMYLTLAYDHRVIDGAYGTQFLAKLKELLENFSDKEVKI